MKLTGKAKEDFRKWYETAYEEEADSGKVPVWMMFDRMPESMQWGVYQDFFIAQGIHLGYEDIDNFFVYDMKEGYSEYYQSRQEVIERVNEIFNEN